jgi:hypothetical protein
VQNCMSFSHKLNYKSVINVGSTFVIIYSRVEIKYFHEVIFLICKGLGQWFPKCGAQLFYSQKINKKHKYN